MPFYNPVEEASVHELELVQVLRGLFLGVHPRVKCDFRLAVVLAQTKAAEDFDRILVIQSSDQVIFWQIIDVLVVLLFLTNVSISHQ